MAQSQFTVLTNQIISNTVITANGVFDLYTSASISNSNGLPSMRMCIDYSDLTPNDIPGGVGVIIEVQNGSHWFPAAYQFEPYRNSENGNKRIILVQPNISTFDDGIDSIMYVGGRTVARISRQQGRIGSTFRVRVLIEETNYGGAAAFQSVKMNILGELFDDA